MYGHLPVKLKSYFLHGKHFFATIVHALLALKLFKLSNGDFKFSVVHAGRIYLQSLCLVRNSRNPNLGLVILQIY